MAYKTTVGKVLLKHYSPADTHAFIDSHELDKKNIGQFFSDLAEKHPEDYKQVSSDLARAGFESATRLGSTVRLGDLLPPSFKASHFKRLNEQIEEIKARKLTKDKEKDAIIDLLNKFSNDVNKELVDTGVKENKTLAKIVKAGARGSPAQYRQTIFSPVSVNDNKGGILTDFIIDRSFAEGLTLPQYLAHTFGSRQASAATKLAVADAGFLGKQLSRAGMTMLVEKHDCGSHRGIAVKTTDKDYLGSFLAIPVDKFNYNNEVTSSMLATLKSKGVNDIVVRSPITCQASEENHPNAVCQLCIGRREKGLPAIGSFIGVIAGTTLAEPLSQGMLNCIRYDTLVRMADYSVKKIQDITKGEMILGADNNGNSFPVKVLRKFNQGLQPVNEYKFRLGCTDQFVTLEATEEHKILCNVKKWSTPAQANNDKLQVLPLKHIGKDFSAVKATSNIQNFDKTEKFAYLTEIKKLGMLQCWDIEVDSTDALFTLANGLIVHNSKHSGGSARSASSFGGFKYVNQMFNIPDTFVHEAPLAQLDGTVKEVRSAPQGGNYVVISHEDGTTEEHYVHPDLPVLAKPGDVVEPGDILSDGIPNPAKITQLKGIGEGRVYFANQIKNTFENSQLGGVNKRNFDTISKNLISHVRITNTKGIGDYLPGTVVNYHSIEKTYQPRLDSKKVRTDQAKGMFLEEPVLHYTIGTKLTHGMLDNIKKNGIDSIVVHDESPGFEPEMHRLLEVPAHEHDWMHALYSTNLERRLIKAVNTGASSSITGPSPVPGLAYAVGFGKKTAEELEEGEPFSFE